MKPCSTASVCSSATASRSTRSHGNDLTRFVVTLKKDRGLGSNTILHNAVIVAVLKRHGRSGITKELPLPERITPLVKIYSHEELARFFAACSDAERALFATFLLTGFRE